MNYKRCLTYFTMASSPLEGKVTWKTAIKHEVRVILIWSLLFLLARFLTISKDHIIPQAFESNVTWARAIVAIQPYYDIALGHFLPRNNSYFGGAVLLLIFLCSYTALMVDTRLGPLLTIPQQLARFLTNLISWLLTSMAAIQILMFSPMFFLHVYYIINQEGYEESYDNYKIAAYYGGGFLAKEYLISMSWLAGTRSLWTLIGLIRMAFTNENTTGSSEVEESTQKVEGSAKKAL